MALFIFQHAALFFVACTVNPLNAFPQVQHPGNVRPLLTRSAWRGARSRSCANGTEFIVTLNDDRKDYLVIDIMNDRTGASPLNHCRTLRHKGAEREGQLNAVSVCIPTSEDLDSHLQVLLSMEGVEAVEENLPVTGMSVPWHLDRIDQESLPLDGQYNPEGTGKGRTVYMADTGVDASHPEFEGRVISGYSTVKGENATNTTSNHGTHTAGLVGSKSCGVATGVRIVPIKVFSDHGEEGSNADIIEGINWVISQQRGNKESVVLSMSLGSEAKEGFHAGEKVLQRAVAAGVIPVVAAGNSAEDACGFWPAQSTNVITVGATDIKDHRSTFSNSGRCVDLYAPGTNVTSTLPRGKFGTMSGTSMATPIVSGTVALYLEKHPTAGLEEMRQALIRNGSGQKAAPVASRTLLVQALERTAWNLLAAKVVAVPNRELQAEQSRMLPGITVATMLSGCCCVLGVIAVSLFLRNRASQNGAIDATIVRLAPVTL